MDYKYPTPQLLLKAICNAIRSKTGNSDEIPHQNIPDELDSIIIDEEEYNIEMQRFIDIIEGTSFVNDRITTVKEKLFHHCTSLTTVNLPKCTSIGDYAFFNCTNLTTINLPECASIGSAAFNSCSALITIDLPECTSIKNNTFQNCTNLTTVNLPECTSIENIAFGGCHMLTTLILSNNQVVTLGNINAFDNSAISGRRGYVYVPDNLVDSYKSDSKWSTYANQIKPLSELPSNLKEEYGYD